MEKKEYKVRIVAGEFEYSKTLFAENGTELINELEQMVFDRTGQKDCTINIEIDSLGEDLQCNCTPPKDKLLCTDCGLMF